MVLATHKVSTASEVSSSNVLENFRSKALTTEEMSNVVGAGKTPVGARTQPVDLQEKLTLDEAMSGQGEKFMEGKLKDPKYDPQTGTVDKMRHNHDHGDGTNTEVHYDRNRSTGEGTGYKIKDDTNANSRGHRYP